MDRLAQSAALLIVASCAGEPRLEYPRTTPGPVEHRWGRFSEARSWPLAASPFSSAHGTGEYSVSVRVSRPYADLYAGLVADHSWPVGMTVAAFHERTEPREAGSVYAMTKTANGRWSYVVARADGVIEAEGVLPLCARCHAEAPADYLFGVPNHR